MSWTEISRSISEEITLIFESMAVGPLPEQILGPVSCTEDLPVSDRTMADPDIFH